jgi:hypothetical protein
VRAAPGRCGDGCGSHADRIAAHGLLFDPVRRPMRAACLTPDVRLPLPNAVALRKLTVGAGGLVVGKQPIGLDATVRVDEVLWTLGTVTGLVCAVTIRYLMLPKHALTSKDTYGFWLMRSCRRWSPPPLERDSLPRCPPATDRLTLSLPRPVRRQPARLPDRHRAALGRLTLTHVFSSKRNLP